jgi:hypothetical protein
LYSQFINLRLGLSKAPRFVPRGQRAPTAKASNKDKDGRANHHRHDHGQVVPNGTAAREKPGNKPKPAPTARYDHCDSDYENRSEK